MMVPIEDHAVADGEQHGADGRRQIGAEAQEGAAVLDVLQPDRIGEERLPRLAGQGLGREVLRHAIAADRRHDEQHQREARPVGVHAEGLLHQNRSSGQ